MATTLPAGSPTDWWMWETKLGSYKAPRLGDCHQAILMDISFWILFLHTCFFFCLKFWMQVLSASPRQSRVTLVSTFFQKTFLALSNHLFIIVSLIIMFPEILFLFLSIMDNLSQLEFRYETIPSWPEWQESINTFLPMRNKFLYYCSIKIHASGFSKLLESIFCLLVVEEIGRASCRERV